MNHHSFDTQKVLTIILGGGQGTRLFPLTKTRCKAAVPIGSKYRLIDIPLSNCIHSCLHSIFIVSQYLGHSLQRHVSQAYRFDQFSDGFIEVLSAQQTLTDFAWYEGTADAVRKNIERIERFRADHVLILSADHLYRMDYRELINYHLGQNADLTVSGIAVTGDEALRMGIFQMDDKNNVRDLIEKPGQPSRLEGLEYSAGSNGKKRYLASMGIYLFKKRFLIELLKDFNSPDFGAHIIPEAIKRGKVRVCRFNGYWVDVGTIDSFFRANLDFTSPLPKFDFYSDAACVYTRPRFLPPGKLIDCNVSHCIIGEGSVIEKTEVKVSVIGIRSVVHGPCRISKSILMGNDYYEREDDTGFIRPLIGPHVTIERAIIDKNVTIGEGSEIRGSDKDLNRDDSNYYIRDGIVVIPSNTTIPPGTKINANDFINAPSITTEKPRNILVDEPPSHPLPLLQPVRIPTVPAPVDNQRV